MTEKINNFQQHTIVIVMKQGNSEKSTVIIQNRDDFEQNYDDDTDEGSFDAEQNDYDQNDATDLSENIEEGQSEGNVEQYQGEVEQYEAEVSEPEYEKEEDYVMGYHSWRIIRAVVILCYIIFRFADIYIIFTSFSGLCGSTDLSASISITVGSVALVSPPTTSPPHKNYNFRYNYFDADENFTDETPTTDFMNATDLLLQVTSGMTSITLIYEFLVAYGIAITIALVIAGYVVLSILGEKLGIDLAECCCACVVLGCCCMLRPLLFFDSFAILILGPFGNVHFFVLGCTRAYINIALRIGFYLSTITLPAVDSYLRNREDPKIGELGHFFTILFKFAVKLCTCSSCLATFANIAYPEEPIFRYTYLIFTVIIGLSALITYYETFLKLVEVVRGCIQQCKPLHNWLNHFIFWPSLVSNLVLLGMNAFILHKYFQTDGFNSSGISLVFNVVSVIFAVTDYVVNGVFCGHGPLRKRIHIHRVCCFSSACMQCHSKSEPEE